MLHSFTWPSSTSNPSVGAHDAPLACYPKSATGLPARRRAELERVARRTARQGEVQPDPDVRRVATGPAADLTDPAANANGILQ